MCHKNLNDLHRHSFKELFFSVVKVIKIFSIVKTKIKVFLQIFLPSLSVSPYSQEVRNFFHYVYILFRHYLLCTHNMYIWQKKRFFKYKANEIENFIAVYRRYTWNEYDLSKKEEREREKENK